MKHTIRAAKKNDISTIVNITKACALHMQQQDIFQWNEQYPSKTAFEKDLQRNELYVLQEDTKVIGTITISTSKDKEYESVNWMTTDATHFYIHRLAVHPSQQGKGIAQQLMTYAERLGKKTGVSSIRLDTFSLNERNQRFYTHRGYQKTGEIYFPNQSDAPFYCYELVL